jgi:hypothetical protein
LGPVDRGSRFPPRINANAEDWGTSGHVRERVALRAVVRNKWLETDSSPGGLRIKLGVRAKKLREGKARKEAAAQSRG